MCAYGQNKKDALLAYNTDIFFLFLLPLYVFFFFKENDTAEPGGKAWLGVWFLKY